jgi:hypothetical protein
VPAFVGDAPSPPPAERLAELDRLLRRLHDDERLCAELRQDISAHVLERRHFERYFERHEPPELQDLPLLHRSPDRILDFLAETQLEHDGARRPRLLGRIRRYLRYGSLHGLDPDDTDVVLRLQSAFYDRRIEQLQTQLSRAEEELRRADFDRLAEQHRELSVQALHAALAARYEGRKLQQYSAHTYRQGRTFQNFTQDYPVLLSTCHSLRASIPDGYLLDYLIIDEASQVNLLAAGLALSCCRNLVVVGDLQQLPHIASNAADLLTPPEAPYDYRDHSILGSLSALYGQDLPRSLLREHYRCDPAIIGFCNKSFYGGKLLPYTSAGAELPMVVVRTSEGNHMRRHREGGRSNQREVDVIAEEVIAGYCPGVDPADIGVTTPYRMQVDKARDVLDQLDTDTVHKFQGRQKKVVILTTVLDDSWRGRTGVSFVDDPHLINVAVSRAVDRFISLPTTA